MEVKETKIVSIDDVIRILEGGKGAELTYEQQLALQHAKKFAASKAKNEKMRKELVAVGDLSERSIVKILDILPKNNMTLRQILAQERKSFSDEEVSKILAITKESG
ncbi:MAG: hypothetical protein KGI06_03335 [Candidatus Micrarchaeota archaeon]|nr:hypothetical protein [Candidatus Micrarchaeota archaeon]